MPQPGQPEDATPQAGVAQTAAGPAGLAAPQQTHVPAGAPVAAVAPPQAPERENAPPGAPVSASPPPTYPQETGRKFGKWLLVILSVALTTLVVLAGWSEWQRSLDAHRAIANLIGLADSGQRSPVLQRLADHLDNAAKGPTAPDEATRRALAERLAALARQQDLSPERAASLRACADGLLSTAGRPTPSCATDIGSIAQQAALGGLSADQFRVLGEAAKHLTDAHQQQRSFWLQFSQMILLNLLLPLLSTVFGFVFGEQAGKAAAAREERAARERADGA